VLGDERALGLLLQLSREQDAGARVEVARALGALADERSAGRLRSLLFDADAAVRDAAFTALERLAESGPLSAAEAALGAPHEDVRRRGLQAVVAACRRKLPQDAREPAWPLLVRALNDASAAVRGEAFKAALNLQICGGGVNTLRFALQSVHPDVRREVLTEAMASVAEPWAWELLLEFLNDPDPKLRQEAFEFATKRNKELEPLEAALKSRHADVRRRAVEALVKRHTKAAQALLATALADDDREVRQNALAALIGDDILDALREALSSPHDDVRARAARALARHGDAGVLPALARLVTVPEPPTGPAQAEWAKLVEEALDGMADLGDPAALPHVLPLLDSIHAELRKAAGRALAFVAMGENPGALSRAMRHDDPQVKYHAALGLALGGDASAAPLVFSADGAKVLPSKERLAAALALGPAGEDQLVTMLDHADVRARTHAFLLLMLLELKAPAGVPSRCLACLACIDARTRLRAARGLDSYRDETLFLQFVKSLFDDRGDEKPWDIPADVVDAVAGLIAHGSVQARARTSNLLGRLFKEEQGAWDRAWAVHRARFAGEIASVRKHAEKTASAAGERYSAARLEELALGAYVGLVREQGGSAGAKGLVGQGPQIAQVRQTALKWVAELARRSPANAQPARAVFVQAMGDPNATVRLQAFDHLRELGMEATQLAAETLGSGHTDLGVRGLELLSGASAGGRVTEAGKAVLDRAMLTRTDDLAIEAARLLATQHPVVEVAATALEAAHAPLRLQAVAWLAAEYEKSPPAAEQLRSALTSRYSAVREAAAIELARKRDAAAFAPLVALLNDARDAATQKRAITALVALGDPRTPAALVDRLSDDPSGTAQAGPILDAVASFRRPEIADRLLTLATREPKLRNAILGIVHSISGYDQPIEDPEDLRPEDRAWLAKQHPRRDAILATLLDRMIGLSPPVLTLRFVPGARWAAGKDVDPVLARLATHPDDNLRRAAVEAIGFRLRKRGGPAEPLLTALSHRDPQTQFLAAEALARAGRGEGLSVLLAAVDSMPALPLRERAIRALGELGDPRALDTLLRIATEDQHVLQREAAEALGHLGHSPEGAEIFKLLERLAMKNPGPLAGNALRGLRWLGTPDAWRVVRHALADESHPWRAVAAEVLGFDDDDPATRDLLLKVTATESDLGVVRAAFDSARRLVGEGSLEPHYAWVQNPNAEYYEDGESIELLSRRGETKRLFEILPRCAPEIQESLAGVLLNRPDPPVADAVAALDTADAATARVAARVLGRAGEAAPTKAREALQAGLDKWLRAWDERRNRPAARDAFDDNEELTDRLTPVVRAFVWAAGRVGAAEASLIRAAASHVDDSLFRPIRREAVIALDKPKPADAVQAALEAAATGEDPEIRTLGADILARRAPNRAARLAAQMLPDHVTFDRVARDLPGDAAVTSALRGAATNVHYQGVALGHLIAGRDADALGRAAADHAAPEAARLGAVEALGKLATETAELKLQAIGKAEGEPAELRKAAWRALRRSKRDRASREKLPGTEATA
jgi:ParB family chromosome partitioning protein